MRKFFLASLSFFFLFFFLPSPVHAITCSLTTEPSPVTTDARTINATIQTSGLVSGQEYFVKMRGVPIREAGQVGPKKFQVNNGVIKINDLNSDAVANSSGQGKFQFQQTSYKLAVVMGEQEYCTVSFNVIRPLQGGSKCSFSFINTTFTPDDEIVFKLVTQDTSGERRLVPKRGPALKSDFNTSCTQTSQLVNQGASLGKLEEGTYYVEVQQGVGPNCGLLGETLCWTTFTVSTKQGGGGVIGGGVGKGTAFKPNCKAIDNDPKKGYECETGLGISLRTSPVGLAGQLLQVVLGLAGGIALLLIVFSGYQMMTAAGNPEKLQGARETLTSAIVGLIFIILSISILRIIGVEILAIPGFRP